MVSGNTGFAGPHPQGWRDSWPCAAVLLSAECWCWDTADLISSLDILLAFASDICDRWHICDNPLLSQIVQGPGASPCYLALSIAPAVTVDPQVSATSSIYSWLAWFPHAVICPCPNLGSIPWGDARWTQLCLTALLVMCLELALHSGLCPEFPEATRGRLCLPVVPPARGGGHNFFSLKSPQLSVHFSSLWSLMQSHWCVEWPSFTSSQLSSSSQV